MSKSGSSSSKPLCGTPEFVFEFVMPFSLFGDRKSAENE